MIKFLLLVNKQGQTRLARYFGDELRGQDERRALEAEAVRRCLARGDRQASFFEHRSHRIVYRRYASLFFLAGVDEDEVRKGGSEASAEERWRGEQRERDANGLRRRRRKKKHARTRAVPRSHFCQRPPAFFIRPANTKQKNRTSSASWSWYTPLSRPWTSTLGRCVCVCV